MERESLRREIRRNSKKLIREILQPAARRVGGEDSYICPFCGHGTHGDGLTFNKKSKDGLNLKCFGCGWSGDIIALFREMGGFDFHTALQGLAVPLGLELDPYQPVQQKGPSAVKSAQVSATTPEEAPGDRPDPPTADYIAYYRACRENLSDPDAAGYLSSRGISQETARAYWLGFDRLSDPANAPGMIGEGYRPHPAPRLIIPTSASHYVGRAIDPNMEKRFAKMNPNREKGAGEAGIFNVNALYAQDVQVVYVVEGDFDALSLLEVGATAIATNSTGNIQKLLALLEQKKTDATLILAFDNDAAGEKATETMKAGLSHLGIRCAVADICGDCKDPNEYLVKDRAGFESAVEKARGLASGKPDNVSLYIDTLMGGEIDRFKADVKTGYPNLDALCDGLYAGLYVIAAVSSLGKTTFAAQMADQIAMQGHDVLYFSLEQSRLEMVSKSLSRLTAKNNRANAVTSLSIRKGSLPPQVMEAAKHYKTAVGDRISIIEGNFNCDLSFVEDYIKTYVARNKDSRPVIFIDYLQILQPETVNGRLQTTKETVDATVSSLKRLSRELGLTVIAISSVNRSNYLSPIDFESLKESGGIEFTADVVWGLQFQCLNEDVFDKEKAIKQKRARIKAAKAETPRRIELCCLKNRYGIASYSAYFQYTPQFDLFEEGFEEYPFDGVPRKAGRKVGE